ncbi:hypothetical protein QZH41_005736 [Actinostola sp. cb2023]|nr:hypothetical protein QZH41_005736 [Actinostola sp. cb2023]
MKGTSGLNIVNISYICSRENERDKETTIVTFQFLENPNEQMFAEKLTSSAMKKEAWLAENDVIMLKVNGQPSLNIKENVEFKANDAEDESILVKKPNLQVHLRNVVDVILVVEMSYSMTPNACKAILKECQSAIQMLSKTTIGQDNLDLNLAVIQFGNHSASSSSPPPTAIIVQGFCKEYDVMSKLKEKGRCGGKNGGNSGMSDALAKVVELAKGGSMRAEATKVCVLISFNNILSSTPKALEYYRCNHGNDVIELTKSLADKEIPLYIIGIHGDAPTMQPDETLYKFEECLLSGVCHIGGGRYLPILKNEIVPNVNEMISSAIKGDVSIENHGEITGEVFKDALNNHFGDPNVIQLANDLKKDLRIKPLKFEKLLQNGRPLEPVTQATERIAFADDLSEAISALERMKEHDPDHNLGIQREVRWYDMDLEFVAHSASPVHKLSDKGVETLEHFKGTGLVEVGKCPRKSLRRDTIEEGRHSMDLEMAARIVRRHMHRMAYYKKKP